MPFVHRRVFYARVGQADQVVELFKEGDRILAQYQAPFRSRVLTDHLSGRSDRVAVEWEVDNINDLDVFFERAMAEPGAQQAMGPFMEKLNQLVHYSEAESWTIR